MSSKHLQTRLKVNARQIDERCPVSGETFEVGDEVVVCQESDVAFSAKHWPEAVSMWGGRCQYCDAVIDSSSSIALPPNSSVSRPLLGWLGVIGWIIALFLAGGACLLFLIIWPSNSATSPTPFAGVTTQQPLIPTSKPPTEPPRPGPTHTPRPEFSIRPYDAERDQNVQSIISLIPNWEGLPSPGHQQWQVNFPANESVRLDLVWCTIDQQTLDENWPHMQYELVIDGYQINLSQLEVQWMLQDEDRWCRGYDGVLTGWAAGRHSYTWIHHIYQSLHDGWDAYQAGDYIMEFTVDVN